MTDDTLTPVKRALLEIRELRARLAASEQRTQTLREPVAIIGMGMRLPGGVRDAAAFEQLLWSGTDAVTEIPAERWSLDEFFDADPDVPGKMITRYGAFIDGVDMFDAEFFGISPREAATMDPQQRVAMQVAWSALEDAGRAGADLAGSRTGVYLGVSNNDYGRALYAHREEIDPYFATGNAYSVVTGRLSYFLGLRGPAISVDTACSSSLVALHLALQALRLGECDQALAGGVNLILTPEMNINFSKASMMAPDGRCKTFDARADGYVRGEGCVMLVLKRLADARSAGDRVLAVLRGSALNQDGRSGGLTAPNGPAQESVIRAALADADVEGRAIGYVETHGTGTPLGDPIEVGALGAALCAQRTQPLAIGSVKTNLGHLEAAAGVTGVIKVVLALQRGEIPPHLHFEQGSPHIDWTLPLEVPTAVQPWAPIDGRRLAGVSSFGFSGTNAHVIVEAAPDVEPAVASSDPQRPLHLLALSARDPAALADLARAHARRLAQGAHGPDLADVAFTAHLGRTHFAQRLTVLGATRQELHGALDAYANGGTHELAVSGRVDPASKPRIAFLFTGQGAQHAGMGRVLFDTEPVFRRMLERCAEGLKPYLERGLLDVMFAPAEQSPINETLYAQPVNFALEVALAELWRSWGIEPVAVMGHSLGEYAAACVAGLISLDDGLRLTAVRGRLTHAHALEGAMAAVFAPEAVVLEELAASGGRLSIAAFNTSEHLVLSGARDAVGAAEARLTAAGVLVKSIRVPHGAHSQQIDPVLAPFGEQLANVQFTAPQIELISNVTGDAAGLEVAGRTDYWLTHMREPVRFAQSMHTLLARGITHFIEIGPHPVLLGMGAENAGADAAIAWLPSLRRDRPEGRDLLESLQRLYVDGAPVDWAGFEAGAQRRRVALPTYPFSERRHWMDIVGSAAAPSTLGALARWEQLTAALERQSMQGPLDLNAASYPAKWACLERLTAAHAMQTLRDAGLFMRAGESLTPDEVLTRADIGASYRHLVQRWLERLVAMGHLEQRGAHFSSPAALPAPKLDALWQEAQTLFADNQPLLAYVRHCGDLVGPVLRGQESPLETLFPGGTEELARGLYEQSSTMRYINALAASAFSCLGATVPAARALRVLEVGAGTGGTTSSLLPHLPADRTRYVFSDVSELFLDRARDRFAAHGFIDYRLFDMERDPVAQGFDPGSFDVIVSANAVHASTDLRQALRRLRELLAPGGVLVLVESTVHLAWFDMTTGLIEGWQQFADDLRTDNPLLAPPAWLGALEVAGFEAAGAWPPAGSEAEALGQHVIVARAPGEPFGAASAGAPNATALKGSAGASAVAGANDSAQGAVAVGDRTGATISAQSSESLRAMLMQALPADRIDLMRDFVRERVVRVLKLPADQPVGRHDRLMDLGFDSLMAVQLRNQLAKGLALDKPLPATLMFDHPTIEALAQHLLGRVAPAGAASVAVAPGAANAAAPEGMTGTTQAGVLGADAVAAMSEEAIEKLLMERLDKR